MCFSVPRISPGGGSTASRRRPIFQMTIHSISSHRESSANALWAKGRSPRWIERCNISPRRRMWTLRADEGSFPSGEANKKLLCLSFLCRRAKGSTGMGCKCGAVQCGAGRSAAYRLAVTLTHYFSNYKQQILKKNNCN